ncbi:DNA primase large subunit [Nematocida sp. AWRm80]|nr:DNA primase large subunit [Nematocida sp. AWRm80]
MKTTPSVLKSNNTSPITFYTEEKPNITKISQYYTLVNERKELYRYLDKYKSIPLEYINATITAINKDINMHYSMKIAATANKSEREEFIQGEIQLFKYRLDLLSEQSLIKVFLEEYLPRLNYPVEYTEDNNTLKIALDTQIINYITNRKIHSSIKKTFSTIEIVAYFTHYNTIPLTNTISNTTNSTIGIRTVSNGYIRTSNTEGIKSILIRGFRNILENSTQEMYRLKEVSEMYLVPEKVTEITNTTINEKYLPVCVKSTISKLISNRHLKYLDRRYLANFFKGIGIPVETTIQFFKSHFNCTEEEFNNSKKGYNYGIQHMYGLKGSKKAYKNIPCGMIIQSTGQEGCVGCPYARGKGDPQKECAKAMEIITGIEQEPILSPVEYYLQAQAEIENKEE